MRRPWPLLVLALLVLAVVFYTTRIRHEMIDFTVWQRAVVRGLHAEPLYRIEDGHYLFKYFPAFTLLMAPYGLIDQDTGKLLWFISSIALLVTLVRWSVAALPDRRLAQRTLVVFAVVLMAKFYARELLLGQPNLLLGVLLVGALLAVQSNRQRLAGGLVGVAAFVKPYALIFIPWLFVTQGWRSAATATVAVTIGLLLPAALYGWSGNLDLLRGWVQTVTDSTAPNLLGHDNVSIASMWAKWLGSGPVASALASITVVGALVLVVVAWRYRRAVSAPEYLECALLLLLIPLISPQGWDYVLLLATPAVVCLVDRWREFSKPWQWLLGVALVLMSLTMFDIMGRALYGRVMALSVVSVCALILAAGLARARTRGLA